MENRNQKTGSFQNMFSFEVIGKIACITTPAQHILLFFVHKQSGMASYVSQVTHWQRIMTTKPVMDILLLLLFLTLGRLRTV